MFIISSTCIQMRKAHNRSRDRTSWRSHLFIIYNFHVEKSFSNKSNENYFPSISEIATQFSPLIGFIIAHNDGLSCRPAMMMSGVDRHFPAIFTPLLPSFFVLSSTIADLPQKCVCIYYIVQPPVFASVTINTEKDQQLQKAHFVCFNVIHQCIGHDKYRKGPTVTESTFCMFKCYPPFETHFY